MCFTVTTGTRWHAVTACQQKLKYIGEDMVEWRTTMKGWGGVAPTHHGIHDPDHDGDGRREGHMLFVLPGFGLKKKSLLSLLKI